MTYNFSDILQKSGVNVFLSHFFAVSLPNNHEINILTMKTMVFTEQTILQVERFLKKLAQKFPMSNDVSTLTDIHVRISQDSGELLAFDDEDQEITRCVVEQWIDNKDENFYEKVAKQLRTTLHKRSDIIDNLGILKPYSFVLEDEDKENRGELYLADDDTIIIGGELMENLDSELDAFFEDLLKET